MSNIAGIPLVTHKLCSLRTSAIGFVIPYQVRVRVRVRVGIFMLSRCRVLGEE